MKTIRELDAVSAIRRSLFGGKYRVQLRDFETIPGRRWGYVLDLDGQIIGDACDRIYHGRGFVVHTENFAGFVPIEHIEFVA